MHHLKNQHLPDSTGANRALEAGDDHNAHGEFPAFAAREQAGSLPNAGPLFHRCRRRGLESNLAVTLALVIAATTTQAAVLTVAGSHLDLGEFIRTTTTFKSLDADGNNAYGSAGYYFPSTVAVNSAAVFDQTDATGDLANPSYLTIARPVGSNAQSALTNTSIDNPALAPGASVANLRSGINFFSTDTSSLIRLTIGSGFPLMGARVGIFTDNHALDMNSYTVTHTTVGSGGSIAGSVNINTVGNNNDGNDFYFFDLRGAVPGDVFTISGTGNGSGFTYLGGITVDTIPEPSAVLLSASGALALLGRRRHRS